MSGNLIIKDFRTLKVWQKANSLEQEIESQLRIFHHMSNIGS